MAKVKIGPEMLEIIGNALISITMEMKAIILRTAYSSTIQEASDFSVALFEKDRLIAQANTLALHIANCTFRIKKILAKCPGEKLRHGDVILQNHPYWGANHTPDMSVTKVVRRGNLVFLPMAFGHWSDVGGMTPGSISGRATEMFQEGILVPPVKLYEDGKLNEALLDVLLSNVRLPELRAGDLRAQVAACNRAEERLYELIERFGLEMLEDSIEEILNNTEERTRARIREIPDDVYEYEDYVDSGGVTEEPMRIHVKVIKKGSDIEFDFSGTSKQTPGPVNSVASGSPGGVYVAFKSMIDPYWANNEGFYRAIKIVLPEGTCVNPNMPAAVGAGSDVRVRIIDTVRGALADVVPISAGSEYGSINHTFIGGMHPKTGKPYLWYEYPAGGHPGSAQKDGCDSMATITGGDTRDYPVERAEAEFPLLCLKYKHRRDSGGPGRHRGGLGVQREMKILDDERYQRIGVSTIWDRSKIPPYGIRGGFSGAPQRVAIIRADGTLEYIPFEFGTKCTLLPIHKDDILSLRTGGGGGYGDPLERDPGAVLQDLREEKISESVASDIYGVIIDKKRGIVDGEATKKQRERIRQSRIYCNATAKEKEEFIGNRRAVRIHPDVLGAMSLEDGDMIEILGKSSVPLRVWTVSNKECSNSKIELDEVAMRMLRVNEGDKLWVRDPNWFVKKTIEQEGMYEKDRN
jgi:N-methylhydantoinase B